MLKSILLLLFAVQAQAAVYTCDIDSRPEHKLNVELYGRKIQSFDYEYPHFWQNGVEHIPLTPLYNANYGLRGEFMVYSCRIDENKYVSEPQVYIVHSECDGGIPVTLKLRFHMTRGGDLQYTKRDGSSDSVTLRNCRQTI